MKTGIRWLSWSVLSALLLVSACFDTEVDRPDNWVPDQQAVSMTVLARNLNFPVAIEHIDNQDPAGIGECSVLRPGMLLVANRGMVGDHANSILAIAPDPATDNPNFFLFANQNNRDRKGESGVDAPTGLSFIGPFVWVSNVASLLGSIAALDPNPCVAPNGPTGNAGEPIDGPLGTGVFGNDDFGFQVVSVYPADNATEVAVNTTIKVKFTQPVDPTTVTKANFKVTVDDYEGVKPAEPEGSFRFWEDDTVVEFIYQPYGLLSERVRYKITLDTNIKDINGNELDGDPRAYGVDDFISYFTTRSLGNPRVVRVTPAENATNVQLRTKVEVCFSKPMKKPAESAFKVVKEGSSTAVSGGDIYPPGDGETCYYYLFTADFAEDTRYCVIVTPAATDMAGNPLDQIPGGDLDLFQSCFSTGAGGASGFCVNNIDPANGGSGVPVSSVITAMFSLPVNTATLPGNFTVSSNLGTVPGSFEALGDGSSIIFHPDSPLSQCSRITITISAGLLSQDGQSFTGWCDNPVAPAISVFDTVCENPYVVSNVPVCGLQNVLIDTVITVNFSEYMNLDSINSNTFTIRENGVQISVNRYVISKGDTAEGYSYAQIKLLDDSGEETYLRPESNYDFEVTIYARDREGNSLDQNRDLRDGLTPFSCSFTTGSDTSPFPPCVVSTVPVEGATDISIFSTVIVCFSQPIDRDTVTEESFTVTGSAGSISGERTVSADNRCIEFQAEPSLPEAETITVAISAGLQDLQGRSIDGNCDGVAGDAYYLTFTSATGAVVINEVVTSPETNWNDAEGTGDGIPFNPIPGEGNPSDEKDEWIEIFNGTSSSINLLVDQWKLVIEDSAVLEITLGTGEMAIEYYSGGSTPDNFKSNTYLIIGNPDNAMNQDVYLQLLNPDGEVADDVELGNKNYKGDGNGDNAPSGSSDSPEDESIARCPNGFDSNLNSSDFLKTSATIASSNNPACTSSPAQSIGAPLPYQETGIGGIVCAGSAPDDHNSLNLLAFGFSVNFQQLYAIDLDDGMYPIMTEITNVSGLCWVPDASGTPGHGKLFLTRTDDTLTMMNLRPSGIVGQPGTRTAPDPSNTNPTTSIYSPYFNLPVGVAYSSYSGTIFIANRGDGTVTECSMAGEILHIYDTSLGPDMLSSIDIGDTLGGETVLLTVTGGRGINEFSGNRGSIMAFQPLH